MTPAKWVLLLILLGGLVLRLANASKAPLELIERDEYIPAALTLSWDHHPIRLAQHPALPAYAIRLSGVVFGRTILGWRAVSIMVGTATILIVYLIATRWWGPGAGLVAAGLLAIERYHIEISARAIDLPLDLFFIALAMYGFARFLFALDQRAEPDTAGRWLYLTAIASAAGFLCKELTALLLPAFLVSLLILRQTAWLKRRHTWIAVALFALVIAPDLYSNLTVTRAERMDLWRRHQEAAATLGVVVNQEAYVQNGLYMSYRDQFSRFRSIGFNKEPFYFYFGSALDRLGIPHKNRFEEFPFMNPILAAVLWLSLIATLVHRPKDKLAIFSLTMFVIMFLPFVLVRLGKPWGKFPSDPEVLWYWVDRTMFPALLVTGRAFSLLTGRVLQRA